MPTPRVVIVGGGFGGLAAAQRLARERVEVTLVDRTNHHLFQPLLYQVATGGLSPANIAAPLRNLFRKKPRVTVVQDEATTVDWERRSLRCADSEHRFDYLLVAAGGRTNYFGESERAALAPGLKSLQDATEIRRRVLASLETAEAAADRPLPSFVVAGGGPTGVEMAGALAELTRHTLKGEFRRIDPCRCRILLIEPGERLLSGFPAGLGRSAEKRLAEMGVEVRLKEFLLEVEEAGVVVGRDDQRLRIEHATTIWAAGVAGAGIAERLGLGPSDLSPANRIRINSDLRMPGRERAFAVGDITSLDDGDGTELPCVAPVAIQQGRHAAENMLRMERGKPTRPFEYRDYGSMAVIGRGAAVADLRGRQLSGYPAWLVWLFVHLLQLVGHENRLLVAAQWGWNYFTRNRSARLILPDGKDREHARQLSER